MNDIVAIVTANPVTVLTNEKTYSEFYARMKAECDEFVPDLSTAASRAKISSQAFKVTRTKTAIDAAGKKLNEDARAQINAVDAQRRKIREELDALADAVRKPLTDWEIAEDARKDRIDQDRAIIADLALSIHPGDTSEELRRRWNELDQFHPELEVHRDAHPDIVDLRQRGLDTLAEALDRALKHEADQAELARLRAEAEARETAERERIERERAATEAAEREAREKAEYAETVKRQAEAAERSQKEAAERERKAIAEAEEKARAEAREAVQKAEAEAARVKREADQREADRHAELKRIADEQAARDADRAHRSKVMAAAKTAIMDLGATEDVAKKIVLAIIAGEVPQVRLTF